MTPKTPRPVRNQPKPASVKAPPGGIGRVLALVPAPLGWLPILAAAALGFLYVRIFGVNVPWAEDWFTVHLLDRQATSGLNWADLWEQYNEHRLLLSRLVVISLGDLTHANMLDFMYGGVIVLAAIVGMFIIAFRRQVPPRAALWLFAPAALLMFSWRQNENFLLGFQLIWVVALALVVATFLILHFGDCQRRLWPFFCAAGTATGAAFSVAMGLMVWPLGLFQLLLLPLNRRRKIILMAVWTAIGVGEALCYFHGYVRADLLPPPGAAPDALWNFFPVIVGLSLTNDPATAQMLGFVILIVAAIAAGLVVASSQWARYSFWLTIMAFSVAALAAITCGRSNAGLVFAQPSRYTNMSLFLVVSCYIVLVSQAIERSSIPLKCLAGLFAGFALVCLYTSDRAEFQQGSGTREFRNYQAFVLCTIDQQPDQAIQIGIGTPQMARDGAAFLKQHAYSVFATGQAGEKYAPLSPTLPQAPGQTQFRFENCGPTADGFAFTGWAVDSADADVAGGVYLVLDGQDYPVFYGLPRPDLAKANLLPNDRMINCGFQRLIPAKLLHSGRHTLGLKILTTDRQAVFKQSVGSFDIP